MRLNGSSQDSIAFSAPFLDNTLQKMLQLQNRMLKSTAELSKAENVEEKIIKEHAAQSAELSRIIALICSEKARREYTPINHPLRRDWELLLTIFRFAEGA